MVTGKAYRSIGVILVVGGILYLFMATTIGTGGNMQDTVEFQPIPTEDVKWKTLHILSQRLDTDSVALRKNDIGEVLVETSPFRHFNEVKVDTLITEISAKENRNTILNSSVKVNKIVKVIEVQPSDDISNKSEDTKSNLPNREPEDKHKNVTVVSNKTIVVIVAYMRTGSTLTAALFQQYPGTFYVFEPIRSLMSVFEKAEKSKKTYAALKYIHGKERNYTASEKYQVKIDEINSWLSCQLDSISIQSLTDDFHKHYTKIMKSFYFCTKGPISGFARQRQGRVPFRIHPHLRQYYDKSKSIDTCLKTAIGMCQRAPLVTLKFIRLKMAHILPFLEFYPNMKIIHLVRDPRGIFNSRLKVRATTRKSFQQNVRNHCTEITEDMKYSKRILEKYKNRLKIVQYEDITESPLEAARSLVEFAGIQFLKPMQDFIRRQTSSTRDSCAYCTQRRNSSITAHKWRTQLDPTYAGYIYEACKISNTILGYLPLTTRTMRNSGIPSRKKVDVHEELLKNNKL